MDCRRYAYAVASVREAENTLLSASFFEQLLQTPTYDASCSLVRDKGIDENTLDKIVSDAWEYLCETAPDKKELEFLTVKNDFHNLKVVLKSMVTGNNADKNYITPCLTDPAELKKHVEEKNFDLLPDWISDAAAEAYNLITSTADGRLTDIFIDKCSLEATVRLAKGNPFSEKLADMTSSLANIRIAARAALTGIGEEINDILFARGCEIDAEGMVRAVNKGVDSVKEFVMNSSYSYLAEYITDFASLEKACDKAIAEFIGDASRVSFGLDPIAAYYIRIETEVKNLRLILRAKHASLPEDIIKERLRDVYV